MCWGLMADPKSIVSIILRGGLGTQLFGVCGVKFEALERGSDSRHPRGAGGRCWEYMCKQKKLCRD